MKRIFGILIFLAILVSFACKNAPMTKADIEATIVNSAGGTKEDPVQLSLKGFSLGDMRSKDSGWFSLLDAIEAAGKYVSLDLSGCKMPTDTFDHRANHAGKDKVVSLSLPDAATIIQAPSSSYQTFVNIKYVRGSNISYTGKNALLAWESLENVDFPKLNATGHGSFEFCRSFNSTSLPEKINYIDDFSFLGCRSLTLTSIPDGVTHIGYTAFRKCERLALTSFPAELKLIGPNAFEDCIGLEEIALPAALTSLGAYAFKGCTNLRTVTINAITPPKAGASTYIKVEPDKWEMFANTHSDLKIKVPANSVQAYKEAEGWREYADKISAM